MDKAIYGIVMAVVTWIVALYYSNRKLQGKVIVQKQELDDAKVSADIKHLSDSELDARLSKHLGSGSQS